MWATITYAFFLLISLGPVILFALHPGRHVDFEWSAALFFGSHSIFVNPIVSFLAIVAFFSQAPAARALDCMSLVMQAVVFALVAISWIYRVKNPLESVDYFSWNALVSWYQLVGWAAVDNAIYAIVQFLLLWCHLRQAGNHVGISASDETQALLRNEL